MSTIRLLPDETEVSCRDGQTLLEALEDGGVAWPSDCRAGYCGTCKARLRAGTVDRGLYMPGALSDDEAAAGYCLPCVATPVQDMIGLERPATGRSGGLAARTARPIRNQQWMVVDKQRRTPTLVELQLRPIGPALRYLPGQYVEIAADEPGSVRRPYSIANAPRSDGEISLHVSLVPQGAVSPWVHRRLGAGDSVRVSGPYGTFIGDTDIQGPVLCLAGGSGLAPILALTEAALRRGYRDPVRLVVSARTPDDVYAAGLLGYWQRRYSNFAADRTITRPGDLAVAPPVGRIDRVLGTIVGDLGEHTVFIAGSAGFVAACRGLVARLGAESGRIHAETYYSRGATPDWVG